MPVDTMVQVLDCLNRVPGWMHQARIVICHGRRDKGEVWCRGVLQPEKKEPDK